MVVLFFRWCLFGSLRLSSVFVGFCLIVVCVFFLAVERSLCGRCRINVVTVYVVGFFL